MNAFTHLEPVGDEFQPVSEADIANIESKIWRRLPEDYSTFLRRYGRCGFSGDPYAGPSILCTFLGGGAGQGSLLKAADVYEDLTADGKLVIADDMAGNPYVIDPMTGKVFFIDFTAAGPIAHHLSTSFSEFIEKIEVKPFDD